MYHPRAIGGGIHHSPRVSLQNLTPSEAKDLYLSTVARSTQNRNPSAVDFWQAYVARTNARGLLTHADPTYVSSPRGAGPILSPRGRISPRNPSKIRGAFLPPIASPRERAFLAKHLTPVASPGSVSFVTGEPLNAVAPNKQSEAEILGDRLSDMQAAFRYIDVDNSGTIGREELERALKVWGIVGEGVTDASVDAVLKACDAKGDGQISYEEFVTAFQRDKYIETSSKPPGDPLVGAMAKLRPGVTPKMLRNAHNVIREKLKTKYGTIARAFRTFDENKNGFLGREEFDFGLLDLNLDGIPRPVIDSLLDIIDVDDDGAEDQDHARDHDIQFREFARVFTVEVSPRPLAPVRLG